MEIEKQKETVEKLNNWGGMTLAKHIGIKFTAVTEDTVTATMPVSPITHQPYGILHGGASCVLAETLGSTLSFINVDTEKVVPVGTNINSNHLRSKTEGLVTGVARFIRKGKTVHVSEIEIRDENGELINHTTMTNNIIPRPA